VTRILPEIKRREIRYFRAMMDVDGDGRVTFQNLNEIVKECNHAATLFEKKQETIDNLKRDLRRLVKNSRREAVRLFGEFDHDGRCVGW
jgi:Ca2+-binding EF-hand superfamily protein